MIAFAPAMARAIGAAEWIEGRRTRLRPVALADCTARYVGWLADPDVNRYLETRWRVQTLETVTEFVAAMIDSPTSYLFAIVRRDDGVHVGNVKLGPVEARHLYADLSYFVGERSAWGMGLATEAVALATRFAFERLRLHRVQAGLYESNIASRRVLEKAAFTFEGRHVKKLRQTADTPWEDHLWFGALRDEWTYPIAR